MVDVVASLTCVVPAWLVVIGAGAWAMRLDPGRAIPLFILGLVGLFASLAALGLVASLLLEVNDASPWGAYKYSAAPFLLTCPVAVQVAALGLLGARAYGAEP